MNPMFLPTKIKEELKRLNVQAPLAVLRASGTLRGEAGEGYLVFIPGAMMLIDRPVGKDQYQVQTATFQNDVKGLAERDEKYNVFLDCEINGEKLSVKFSSFEKDEIQKTLVKIGAAEEKRTATTPAAAATNAKVDENAFSPRIGVAAALMFMAALDKEIDPAEDLYIRNFCEGNQRILLPALRVYKACSLEDLIQSLVALNEEQKLCAMANLLEVAMADGALTSKEQALVRQCMTAWGVREEHYQSLREALLIKNNWSVLGA